MLAAGCSFATVHGPPATPCTRESHAPAIDAALLVAGALGSIGGLFVFFADDPATSADGSYQITAGYTALIVGSLIGGVVAGVSSTYGRRTIEKCRRAQPGP